MAGAAKPGTLVNGALAAGNARRGAKYPKLVIQC